VNYNRGVPAISAGLMMFRVQNGQLQSLLVHPGGPFWKNKDLGAWTIPKGHLNNGEQPLEAAIREFQEETGLESSRPYLPLGQVKQRSGKIVHAWAFQGDCDPTTINSNTFELEWPPKSGLLRHFPEIDRAQFFSMDDARLKILPAQLHFLETLEGLVRPSG
jgi:predicted NUDIX family NTP pyrophosphohydrolase